MILRRANLLFWIGSLLYLTSFFLVAVEKAGEGMSELRGYTCAFYSFYWSLGVLLEIWHGFHRPASETLDALSILISGWINPIFLLNATILYFKPLNLVIRAIMLMGVLIMIPWCWVFFHFERLSPREGHFLWIFAMLAVLFSQLQKAPALLEQSKPLV